jgi:phospholipid/cholesterol/gamma-HCH transport system substrate-binding protein
MSAKAPLMVGIFVLGGLGVTLYLAMKVDTGEDSIWDPGGSKSMYYVQFKSAGGLKETDAVDYAGIPAGRVREIEIMEADNMVKLTFSVEDKYTIRENDTISIGQNNLLGGKRLKIEMPAEGERGAKIDPGSEIINKTETDMIASITSAFKKISSMVDENKDGVKKLIDNLSEVSEKLNKPGSSLGNLINDEKMGTELKDTITDIRGITKQLREDVEGDDGLLSKLLRDKETSDKFDEIVENFRTASKSIDEITAKANDPTNRGLLARVINDEQLADSVQDTIYSANDAFSELGELAVEVREGDGTIGKLIREPELYDNLNAAVADVRDITEQISDGKGTLGRIIYEDDIADSLSKLLNGASDAIEDAREQAPLTAFGTALLGGLQ